MVIKTMPMVFQTNVVDVNDNEQRTPIKRAFRTVASCSGKRISVRHFLISQFISDNIYVATDTLRQLQAKGS